MKTLIILSVYCLTGLIATGQQAELLKDINPGTGSAYIQYMTQIGNKVVFKAVNSSNSNNEPWVTDGTPEGTYMLKEINPGTSTGSNMGPVVFFNNEAYFSADDGTHGAELWKTNGTTDGTVMVKDIFPGISGGRPGDLAVFKDALYFCAYHPDHGYELWKTCGTEETTVLVADLSEESASTQPGYIYPSQNLMYFNSLISLKLYYSDGTPAGSGMASDQVKVGQLDEPYFTGYNGSVFFRGTDLSGTDSKGTQLWKIDVTTASRVTAIIDEKEDLDPRYLTVASGLLFFAGIDQVNGRELWAYNGANAFMVKNTNPSGHGYMRGAFFICFKDRLIFTAGDLATGEELWVSDGTESGTRMIKDIYPGAMSSFPISPVIIGDTLYFSADDGTSAELWRLTSPDGQPEKFTDITGGGAYGDQLRRINKTFVFNAGKPEYGDELWKMTISGNTAINEKYNELSSLLVIMPNPVTGNSMIIIPPEIALPAEMIICDLTGSIITSANVNDNQVQLSDLTTNLKPGMYLLKVNSGRKQASAKFIVSH